MREGKQSSRKDLLHGTLEMLILKTLTAAPLHGYGIAREIQRNSEEVLLIEEGSLYPALHRMERNGLIRASWGTSESKRRAKFYRLTTLGEGRLREESAMWTRFWKAVSQVLEQA